ncbi:2'-5' RNA ligase family protein [Paucibacter soli]|uniref:2'-5' RNA ligase family protein n=1 Tax=Paucibacter soli TaxID=3133433 RepID=UPI00309EE130
MDDGKPHPTDRLFFALRPDAATCERIAALQQALRAEHGLRGRASRPEHFHLTLRMVGDFSGLPLALVEALCAQAGLLHMPALELALDRLQSFTQRRHRNFPLVLLAGESLAPLRAFQAELDQALIAIGLAPAAGGFTPHLTLGYDDHALAPQPIAPLRWRADEFLLIHSLIGRRSHRVLGRWSAVGVGLPHPGERSSAPPGAGSQGAN